MKKYLTVLTALLVTACTSGTPEQYYRPLGATEQLTISGNFNQLSYEHKVMVNGTVAVTGNLPYNGDDASFSGQYNDIAVTSDCHWKSKTDLRCLVKMNGEQAANLAFN